MPSRIIFLCARGSGRSLLAASLLASVAGSRFEIWSTPPQTVEEHSLVEEVLQEQEFALLSSDRLIQPTFGMQWDEGVILCSGAADT